MTVNGTDEHILRTLWSKLFYFDLADLLFALNYVGFGLGAGCFYQCHKELQYREFNEFYPLILGSGMVGITHLALNHNPQKIAELWAAARAHGKPTQKRMQEASSEAKTAIEALLLEVSPTMRPE